MSDTTDRLGLVYMEGIDLSAQIDDINQAQMEQLDANAAVFGQGLFANRPVSTPGSPGVQGRFYYATDTGLLYYDRGTEWVTIGPVPDGAVTEAKLSPGVAAQLGVSQAGAVRRGKSIITTEESRSGSSYGLMPTPDRVSGIVLPSDGLLIVGYQAAWKQSVDGAQAAIHIGAEQQRLMVQASTTSRREAAALDATVNEWAILSTSFLGLFSSPVIGVTSPTFPTTGVALGVQGGLPSRIALNDSELQEGGAMGGPCVIWAAAGTYDISVQFKNSSGNVSARDRRLWVLALGF